MNIIEKKCEQAEKSSMKVTVTVSKEDTKKEYQNLLKDYAKKVSISGFRKGFVPLSILEKKYGEMIKEEACVKVIDDAWKEVVETLDKKPLGYSAPELVNEEKMKTTIEEDLVFTIKYDYLPTVEINNYKGIEVKVDVAKVEDCDIENELKKIQEQNAMVVIKKDEVVAKDDVVTIDYAEVENDAIVEKTKREDFVWTVGTGYNLYKLDDDVIGMKKGETKVFDKTLDDKNVKLSVTIKEIKVKELPAIDDDLAMDVSEKFKTLADLKNDISEKLNEYLNNKKRAVIIQQVLDKIESEITFDIPDSMIKAGLEDNWERILQENKLTEDQLLSFLKMQNKNKEDIYNEFRPQAEKNIKDELVLTKIVELENFQITAEEEDKKYAELAEMYKQKVEDIKKNFANEGYKEIIFGEIKQNKAIDLLVSSAVVKNGDKKSFEDFISNK